MIMIQNEQIDVQQYDIIEVMVENEVEELEVMVEMPLLETMLDEVEVDEVDTSLEIEVIDDDDEEFINEYCMHNDELEVMVEYSVGVEIDEND